MFYIVQYIFYMTLYDVYTFELVLLIRQILAAWRCLGAWVWNCPAEVLLPVHLLSGMVLTGKAETFVQRHGHICIVMFDINDTASIF